MKNFVFKSNKSDLQKIVSINKLEIINKNLLYLTHEVDKCVVLLNKLEHSSNLQRQVDEYFEEEDKEHIPDSEKDEA